MFVLLYSLFLPCLQSLPASESFPMSQLFASGGQSIGNFSFNISPTNEHLGLISFRMDWLDLLAVQEELYKKDLHDPDNQDGVVTQLEPDILECEVKCALGSITTNKASGDDGIPVELFQTLKDGAVKGLHSICHLGWS